MKRIIYSVVILFVFIISSFEVYAISGSTMVCVGSTQTYTLSASSSYTIGWAWSISSGATITSGQGTKTITIQFTTAGGANLNVTGHNITENLVIISYAQPSSVGPISGASIVCQGSSGTYSIPAIPYANTYYWFPSSGITKTSQNGNYATFNFSSTFTSGTITCYGVIPIILPLFCTKGLIC